MATIRIVSVNSDAGQRHYESTKRMEPPPTNPMQWLVKLLYPVGHLYLPARGVRSHSSQRKINPLVFMS
jgi:hypothetical protein